MQSILITGCSTGIGWCAAETLHKRGYQVFATARKEEDLKKLSALGVESIKLEMADSESIQLALRTVLEKTGGTLDALFNNVGYAIPGAVEDLSREMMRDQFEANVFGLMELTNLVVPVMRKQGHGRIVHNTSILGVVALPYRGNYNASKFALEAYTSTLRQELRQANIQVCIIAPGPIETRFRATASKSFEENLSDKASVHADNYQKMVNHFQETTASEKKMTLPPDAVVAKLIDALESKHPKARYYVGLPAHMFAWLRRLLPDAALDWVIARVMSGEVK
ncbi:MAG: SDR family NAD(P)-dependent oxidoreductase [Pseudomonadota bacterium]